MSLGSQACPARTRALRDDGTPLANAMANAPTNQLHREGRDQKCDNENGSKRVGYGARQQGGREPGTMVDSIQDRGLRVSVGEGPRQGIESAVTRVGGDEPPSRACWKNERRSPEDHGKAAVNHEAGRPLWVNDQAPLTRRRRSLSGRHNRPKADPSDGCQLPKSLRTVGRIEARTDLDGSPVTSGGGRSQRLC